MVFQSLIRFAPRVKGPDEWWRKRKIFRLAAHFSRRNRNVYKLAIRAVHKSFWKMTARRRDRKVEVTELREHRIDSGCKEHGFSGRALFAGLRRCNILLNRKTLQDLAIWEPRSFKSLVDIAWARCKQDNLYITRTLEKPSNVVTTSEIK